MNMKYYNEKEQKIAAWSIDNKIKSQKESSSKFKPNLLLENKNLTKSLENQIKQFLKSIEIIN